MTSISKRHTTSSGQYDRICRCSFLPEAVVKIHHDSLYLYSALSLLPDDVEDASHETIVALVGRTRNAIQLIIVSNAELTRDNIAVVVEREQSLQISCYQNRPMASIMVHVRLFLLFCR